MKQFFIPILIIILLLGLFIPIPSGLLDYLVILNVLLAIVLLFSVLLVEYPTQLTTLPSFLLILTLFRLVTNISTTRQILAGVEPGKIIPLIGEVVIQGSVVIGLVIFGILTLVQLIVVSKGAERVAEVSARFTLDALPGKQMSIDADVRAGLIDFSEARLKRQETQIESRFYGALDGAMKFIKGDAIVGILITFVNLIGGLASGILVQELSLIQAINYYSLMTIGDGVISQIPAILNSIAAGILVTRVVGLEKSNLSNDLTQQLFTNQGVKIIIILISLVFACLPGIPSLPFLMMAVIFFGLALAYQKPKKSLLINSNIDSKVYLPELLVIQLSKINVDLAPQLFALQIKHDFYDLTGLVIPAPKIKIADQSADYQLILRGEVFLSNNFLSKERTIEKLSLDIAVQLQKYSLDLLDDRTTRALLELWEKTAPYQVNYLIPDKITITRITTLLKDLILEGVYPKNFDLLIQTVAEHIEQKPTNLQLLNLIRQAMKYQICRKYLNTQELLAVTLDPQIDHCFFQASQHGKSFKIDFLELIILKLQQISLNGQEVVLVCSMPVRRFLWQCLKASGLNVIVLAYEEILPSIKIKSLLCVTPEIQQLDPVNDSSLQLI